MDRRLFLVFVALSLVLQAVTAWALLDLRGQLVGAAAPIPTGTAPDVAGDPYAPTR